MKHAKVASVILLIACVSLLISGTSSRAADAGNVEKGKALYDESCAKCHGNTGAGDGRAGRELDPKPNPFNDKSKLATDEVLFKGTRGGGKAVGKSGTMEAFPNLTDAQINDVIAYIKTLAK